MESGVFAWNVQSIQSSATLMTLTQKHQEFLSKQKKVKVTVMIWYWNIWLREIIVLRFCVNYLAATFAIKYSVNIYMLDEESFLRKFKLIIKWLNFLWLKLLHCFFLTSRRHSLGLWLSFVTMTRNFLTTFGLTCSLSCGNFSPINNNR